jgi:hypothetical protein
MEVWQYVVKQISHNLKGEWDLRQGKVRVRRLVMGVRIEMHVKYAIARGNDRSKERQHLRIGL